VEKISLAVNNYFSSLEGGEVAAPEGEVAAEAAEGEETSPEGLGAEEAAPQDASAGDLAADETAEIPAVTDEAEAATLEQTQEPAEEPASSEGKK
jgi:hypothetical protein